MREESEFAVGMARMARDLLAQDSVQDTLNRIVEYGVELIEGCEHAGILLLQGGNRVETAAATSQLVHDSDRAQGELGEGPCFDTVEDKQQIYRIADMRDTGGRWSRFAPRAAALGIGSMMGFLLFTEERSLGSLNLYSSQPNAFGEHSELGGWLLASHAAVAFSAARTSSNLQYAIGTRQIIGEALGIIMERCKLPDDQAFQLLRKISQDRNIKIRDLAEAITSTGDLPG